MLKPQKQLLVATTNQDHDLHQFPQGWHSSFLCKSSVQDCVNDDCVMHIIQGHSLYQLNGLETDLQEPRNIKLGCLSKANISATRKKRDKLRVRFSVVQIREYQLTLGDHPHADAFPLSLDWAHTPAKVLNLAEYEIRISSGKRSKAHRLTTLDRFVRLTRVSGILPRELKAQEKQRQQLNHIEVFDNNESPKVDEDDADCTDETKRGDAHGGGELPVEALPVKLEDFIWEDVDFENDDHLLFSIRQELSYDFWD